jgi:hypothetical protein
MHSSLRSRVGVRPEVTRDNMGHATGGRDAKRLQPDVVGRHHGTTDAGSNMKFESRRVRRVLDGAQPQPGSQNRIDRVNQALRG